METHDLKSCPLGAAEKWIGTDGKYYADDQVEHTVRVTGGRMAVKAASRHSGQAVDKWFEAIVEASNGKHRVFYASDRPVIGSTCDGIAKPNKVIGYVCYKQGESPPDKDVLQAVDRQGDFPSHRDLENPPDYVTLRDDYWELHDALAAERQQRERSDRFREKLKAKYRLLEEQLLSAQAALKQLMAMDSPDFGRKLIAGEVHDIASKALHL